MPRGIANTLIVLLLIAAKPALGATYDPLDTGKQTVETIDLTVHDADRSRDLPLRVYLPGHNGPSAVVLFSHGLGGACTNNPYLGEHWAKRGYVAVFMQHPGSDESVWQDVPAAQRMRAMRQAASGQNFKLRVDDVPAVLDQLQRWNNDNAHALHGRLDLDHVGMAGHSFGAVTTQAVSGQAYANRQPFTDPRIDAALPMSPSAPSRGSADKAFGDVGIPWMLMTGTLDEAAIGDTTVAERLAVYPALPPGDKYELVLKDAEHSAFSDRSLPGDREARNPNHHRVILALSTAFWDAYLKDDPHALQWLSGDNVLDLLEAGDTWQHK